MVAVADVEILGKENQAHVRYMVVYIVPIHQSPYLFDGNEVKQQKKI